MFAEVVAALLKGDRRIRALDLRHSQLNDNGAPRPRECSESDTAGSPCVLCRVFCLSGRLGAAVAGGSPDGPARGLGSDPEVSALPGPALSVSLPLRALRRRREELHCHPVGHTGLQFLLGPSAQPFLKGSSPPLSSSLLFARPGSALFPAPSPQPGGALTARAAEENEKKPSTPPPPPLSLRRGLRLPDAFRRPADPGTSRLRHVRLHCICLAVGV